MSSSPDSFHLKKEDKRRNRLEGSLPRTFKYLIFCNKSSITFHNGFKSLKSREHFSTIVAILMKNWILNSSLKSCTCCNMRLAKLKILLVFYCGPFWSTMVEVTLYYYKVVDSNPAAQCCPFYSLCFLIGSWRYIMRHKMDTQLCCCEADSIDTWRVKNPLCILSFLILITVILQEVAESLPSAEVLCGSLLWIIFNLFCLETKIIVDCWWLNCFETGIKKQNSNLRPARKGFGWTTMPYWLPQFRVWSLK